jgi:hypothetical protein
MYGDKVADARQPLTFAAQRHTFREYCRDYPEQVSVDLIAVNNPADLAVTVSAGGGR